jgi:hypothetical protein
MCWCSVWYLLYITLLAARIWGWLLDFWKICASLPQWQTDTEGWPNLVSKSHTYLIYEATLSVNPGIIFSHVVTALVGLGLLCYVPWSHSDTQHSVGLLWTSDRPVPETSTWQHTTLTRERHPRPSGIRTRNPSKRAAADPRLRRRSLTLYGKGKELYLRLANVSYTFIHTNMRHYVEKYNI